MEEQGFQDVLFIGDDTILLNNLLYQIFIDKKISTIFVPTLDAGMKYIKEEEPKLIIFDSVTVSKLEPSIVIPLIKKIKVPIFFINATPGMWTHDIARQIKETSVSIYKRPLFVDNFLDTVQRMLKRKSA